MSTAFDNPFERIRSVFVGQDDAVNATPASKGELKQKLFDLIPDCVSLHTPSGEAEMFSARCTAAFGQTECDLLGLAFLQQVHVQDRVEVLKAISDCSSTQTMRRIEFRLSQSAKASVDATFDQWREMTCQPFIKAANDVNGEISSERCRVIVVTRDISRRKRLEAQLVAEREVAESASVAKGRFLANMSHELRTPLNAILGFSEMLSSDVVAHFDETRKREYAGHIHDSASHLLNVLNDILDMSKIESGKYEIFPEPFNLASALENTVGIIQGQAIAKEVDVSFFKVNDLPEICADQRAVKQIMLNLLSNAVKFTDAGGKVFVRAERIARRIEISVRDTGIGISPEHIGNLGEPFYQADSKYDRKYEGTGLGLSVVRGLVELHGGKLDIQSEKTVGTTVTVTLPLVAVNSGPVPANEEAEIVHIHGHGTQSQKSKSDGPFASLGDSVVTASQFARQNK